MIRETLEIQRVLSDALDSNIRMTLNYNFLEVDTIKKNMNLVSESKKIEISIISSNNEFKIDSLLLSMNINYLSSYSIKEFAKKCNKKFNFKDH